MSQPTEKEINEYYIKLTGKACIPEPLENGKGYRVSIEGEVTADGTTNNHNGTFNRWFKFEPILVSILKDHGEIITAKDTRSQSSKVRRNIYKWWETSASNLDSEEFYNKVTNQILLELPEIIDRAI